MHFSIILSNADFILKGYLTMIKIFQDENSNHDYSSVPMAGLPMIGALMGMCIGGPIGMLAGVKIGGFSAVMGSILGYTGASVVKEHQDFREYIDNHYEQVETRKSSSS